LYCQKALQAAKPQEATLYNREAQRLLEIVLRQYPTYERSTEVRAMRDALAKQVPDGSR
jgi:hypothetical protein